MTELLQQLLDGMATGAIYASLALALVLIYRSTGIVNFAQGEFAMLSAYLAWAMTSAGVNVAAAIGVTIVVSFVAGAAIERVMVRPVEGSSELAVVIVTLGLFLAGNGVAGWIFGFTIQEFPSPFPEGLVTVGGLRVAYNSIGTIATLAGAVGLLGLLLTRTTIGLKIRAAAANPDSARLAGINVSRTLTLGWGIAAAVGALSGVLVAPQVFLEPNMMFGVLIYAFAAAALGGFDSPLGAVIGGLLVGVTERLAGSYVDVIGSDLSIIVPLALIFAVLMVRPAGLFGTREITKV